MSKRLSKFIQLGIVGIWVCLAVTLVYRHYISGSDYGSIQSLSAGTFKTGEEWLGIYMQNQKIGYTRLLSEKIGNEYRFTQYSETRVSANEKDPKNTTSFTCLTDDQFRMKSFEFESRNGNALAKSRGELDEDNMLLVFMESGGEKKTYAEKMESRPYLPLTMKQMLFASGLEKGKRFTIPVLNILTLQADMVVVEVEELLPVKLGINVNTAYRLQVGGNTSWITDGGVTLKEVNASGLTLYAGTEDTVKSDEVKPFVDFLSLPVIQSNKVLSAPEQLDVLKVRLSGIDYSDFPLIGEGRQALKDGYVEISRESTDSMKEQTYDLPYGENDLSAFLSATSFVQSDHHTVLYNARKFVDIEKNAFRLARFLTSNLYLTINKRPSFHILSSMDIFKTHAGESNEHTVMFTSFARAAGMPTRMVGGLVYLNGYFYYHTWPETWHGQWVPVDPAMGQFPADVTHIRLVEGDIDTIAYFGQRMKDIKIEVVEAL